MKILPAISCTFLVGCGIDRVELQSIEIDHYSDNARNAKLAEDLAHYDRQYFVYQLTAFSEEMVTGVHLGHSASPEGEKSSFRIRYDLNHPLVSENISELRIQFDEFIPQMAAAHASKEILFAELSPIGVSWLERLFIDSPEDLLAEGSQGLRETTGIDELASILEELKNSYGPLEDISDFRSQYYQKTPYYQEAITLLYSAQSPMEGSVWVLLSWESTEDQWSISGFNIWPRPE